MLFLKLLFLPIYLPIAIIISILKFIGLIGYTRDIFEFFE